MATDKSKADICRNLSRYLGSADLSDFTIISNGSTWKVHRLVLSLHSSVLGKACNGDFREAKQGRMDLSEHAQEHVSSLIQFLYKFSYDVEGSLTHEQKLCFHVQMGIIGDKYDISGLKELSTEKFNSIIDQTQTGAELATATTLAYAASLATTEIRQSTVALITKKRNLISKEIEEVMATQPSFAADLVRSLVPKHPKPVEAEDSRYRCPKANCGGFISAHISGTSNNFYTCPHCKTRNPGYTWANHRG